MAALDPAIAARIASAKGFVLDMDGTLALGDSESGGHRALPGALDLLAALRRRGTPFRVFTNGTAKTPADYAAILRHAGFDLANEEMMTPSTSAAIWLAKRGVKRVRVLGNAGSQGPLREAGIEIVAPAEHAEGVEAVYTAWHRDFVFADLEAACDSVWAGARLVSASHVPFFATADGRGIGTSFAINSMITALTAKRATVLGKPSRAALDAARASMGLRAADHARLVVIGDDPALETRMARDAGALAIGITTGLSDARAFAERPPRERPDLVLDSLEPLLRLLR